MFDYQKVVNGVPRLQRCVVWCKRCGRSELVNSARCLRSGWPECCGETMTIDSPSEREVKGDESS